MKTEDVTYKDGATTCKGFLAYDEKASGKRPGVVVFHEGWGLTEHAMERAKMLVGLGYVALAADMYGDRTVVTEMADMGKLIGDLRSDPKKLLARAQAALNTLAAHPQVDAKRMGAIGFCFGGSTVLALARGGVDLKGVVSFHGALDTTTPAKSGGVKASILVCTGADDPMIPANVVTAFEEEMRASGADWQVISYGNTVHSFTNPAADGKAMPAIKYDKKADTRSWASMKGFFEEVFAR